MGIVTKMGDDGTTTLMYGRRVAKNCPRVEVYGHVDELNSALGIARAAAEQSFVRERLFAIQQDLIILMGELATAPEDRNRFLQDGFKPIALEHTHKLDTLATELEAQGLYGRGWAIPGANPCSAALDLARTICRRAERHVCGLDQNGELGNNEILVFTNRLSDVLWLLARWVDKQQAQFRGEGPVLV